MNKFSESRKSKKFFVIFFITVCAFVLSSCIASKSTTDSGKLRVHFLDVGQADSELIQLANGEVMLIDGGNRGDADFLVKYIKSLDIEKIDYLLATHPHEDHVGGLPEVVRAFEIGKVYMPKKTANSRIFEALITEIKNKNLKITEAKNGMTILEDRDTKISIVAPVGKGYEKINDYSIVNKLQYKNISLLFTGDAERDSELEILNTDVDLKADILKVAHHGSDSSSSAEFLDRVKPKYAVISSGKENNYGHPNKEVIDRLNKRNIKALRTDEMGTIVLETDGRSADLKSLR